MVLVHATLRIIRQARPRWWVLENVHGATRAIGAIIGPPVACYGSFYLWGVFPPFVAEVGRTKTKLSGRRRAERRAAIPWVISDGLVRACELLDAELAHVPRARPELPPSSPRAGVELPPPASELAPLEPPPALRRRPRWPRTLGNFALFRRRPGGAVKLWTERVGAYVRVSSRAQDWPTQKHAIEQCAAARGDVHRTWFREKMSAKTTDRPELAQVRRMARAGGRSVVRLPPRPPHPFGHPRHARGGPRVRAHGCELRTVADGFTSTGRRLTSCSRSWPGRRRWRGSQRTSGLPRRESASRLRVDAGGAPRG